MAPKTVEKNRRKLTQAEVPAVTLESVGLGLWFAWSWCGFFCNPFGTASAQPAHASQMCHVICFAVTGIILFAFTRIFRSRPVAPHAKTRVGLLVIEQCSFLLGLLFMLYGFTHENSETSAFAAACVGAGLSGVGYALLSTHWTVLFGKIKRRELVPTVSLALITGFLTFTVFNSLRNTVLVAFVILIPIASSATSWIASTRSNAHLNTSAAAGTASTIEQVHGDQKKAAVSFLVAQFLYAVVVGYLRVIGASRLSGPGGEAVVLFAGTAVVGLVTVLIVRVLEKSIAINSFFKWASILMSMGLLASLLTPDRIPLLAAAIALAGWAVLEIGAWSAGYDMRDSFNEWGLESVYLLSRCLVFLGIASGTAICLALDAAHIQGEWVSSYAAVLLAIILILSTLLFPKTDAWSSAQAEKAHADEIREEAQRLREQTLREEREQANRFESKAIAIACRKLSSSCKLTPRETEVLELLARGRNAKSIEKALVLSNSTVKTHIRHVYEKVGVHSHQELIDLVETLKR